MADLVDRVFENPAMSGGLMVVALTATAIVSNAMFLQNSHHPDPLFMTRPQAVRDAPAAALPVPVPRRQPNVVIPPLPRLAPIARAQAPAADAAAIGAPASAAPLLPPAPTVDTTAQLITATQRELARLGLYAGAIDGIAGSRTAAAISAYQTAAGLMPTGVSTPELLDAMKLPLPPRNVPLVAVNDAAAAAAAELDARERSRAEAIAAEQHARAEAQLQQNYRIVQGALNRIGYGPLAIDGAASAATADAIRRFELDNGLPITGEASDTLIGRLLAIGAIKAT